MKIALIQFNPWDKVYHFNIDGFELEKGDRVVVKTEMGMEIGEVIGFAESSCEGAGCQCPNKKGQCPHNEEKEREIKPIIRIAEEDDLKKVPSDKEKKEALAFCKDKIDSLSLPMKLVDVHFAFDGTRMTFAFIADTRVDFRELVKDLTRHFNRAIRLQQIGIRDEAKMMGDLGPCGRRLCCGGFLKELTSITSEMADIQQCGHRGSERISGVCGRLMCCLAYEQKGYEELLEKMPPLGAKVNVDGKRGKVVGHNLLKQSVRVEFESEKNERTVVEVDLNRNKK